MNAAHFHLMFNHLPIIGLGFALILNFVAFFMSSPEVKKLSFWFYVLIAILSVLPIVTGDGAQEIVKTYPGIDTEAIENHETWGYVLFYGLLGNGLISLICLWFFGKKPDLVKKLGIATFIIGILFVFLAYQAGTTGGSIRHPEIEAGAYRN